MCCVSQKEMGSAIPNNAVDNANQTERKERSCAIFFATRSNAAKIVPLAPKPRSAIETTM